MSEINNILYFIADQSGVLFETESIDEAKQALTTRRAVIKQTKKLFHSGPSTIRVVVTTDIEDSDDL